MRFETYLKVIYVKNEWHRVNNSIVLDSISTFFHLEQVKYPHQMCKNMFKNHNLELMDNAIKKRSSKKNQIYTNVVILVQSR